MFIQSSSFLGGLNSLKIVMIIIKPLLSLEKFIHITQMYVGPKNSLHLSLNL